MMKKALCIMACLTGIAGTVSAGENFYNGGFEENLFPEQSWQKPLTANHCFWVKSLAVSVLLLCRKPNCRGSRIKMLKVFRTVFLLLTSILKPAMNYPLTTCREMSATGEALLFWTAKAKFSAGRSCR